MADDYVFEGRELELVEELAEVRDVMKGLKTQESGLRTQILDLLSGAERGLTASGSQIASVQVQHRRSVNAAKLEALFPEVYEQVVEEKTVTVLKIG